MKPSDTLPKPVTKRGKDDQTVKEMAQELGLGVCMMGVIARDMVQKGIWSRYRFKIDGRSVWLYHVEK